MHVYLLVLVGHSEEVEVGLVKAEAQAGLAAGLAVGRRKAEG